MFLLSKFFFTDYLFLIPIFIIGLITSFEDFKYGKIKNKWIKIGFLWGITIFGLYILWNFTFWIFEHFGISPYSFSVFKFSYLGEVILNTSIALGIGFLMWFWNVWSAGDAKLFTLFSFLLPLKFYSKTYLSYFPSFALLLNIFIVALGIFLIILVFTFIHRTFIKKKETLTEEEKINRKKEFKNNIFLLFKEILNLLVIFFVMVSFFGLFFKSIIGENLTYFFTVILGLEKWVLLITFLGVFVFLMKFLQKIKKVFYIAAVVLLIWFFYKWIGLNQSPVLIMKPMLSVTAIIIFGGFTFRKMFDWYVKEKEIQKVKTGELKPGMRLTEETINTLKGKEGKLFEKSIGKIYSDGLNIEQIVFLKKFAEEKGIKLLEVYKPSPFAILIFIGLIVTILFRGSIIASFIG